MSAPRAMPTATAADVPSTR